ncbi:hypothetical protein AURDEDRAFT_171090 [Auricularia subglabra TFB-10046 SS5]|nr:hypothetical protein AURDEDRAFT_171090 [Auricularia subglabra TFB-10046 SS5]
MPDLAEASEQSMSKLFQNEETNELLTELIRDCNKDLALAVKVGQRTVSSLKGIIWQLESFRERLDGAMRRDTPKS